MQNLAVCNVYEPGSVFKIIVTSFALEYELVNEETMFDCTMATVVNRGRNVPLPRDHTPFDKLTFVDAVRKSSNRAVAQMAMMIGEKKFYDCVQAYGFGEKAGYGFDGESAGILFPVSKWDAWTLTRMPMGHAVGVVPLQIHCAISTIANDGVLLKPNLCRHVIDNGIEILSLNPVVKRHVISQQTAIRMRKVMHNPGNGKLKNGIEFGGKSGTGQKIINGRYSHENHTSSYSGFFPVNVPKFVITVIVDNAKVERGTAWGSIVSLPAFKNIAEKISQYLDM
jgi:cell division protein FtsI/penicillin-binding protein 2